MKRVTGWLGRLAIITVILALSFSSFVAGLYRQSLDRFSFHISRAYHSRDVGALSDAKKELDRIQSIRALPAKVGLGWLMNLTVFRKEYINRGVYAYLTGDYESVEKHLKGKEDYLAYRILGGTYFRMAKSIVQSRSSRGDLLRENTRRAEEYFKRALQEGPEINLGDRWNDVWNYDLITDYKLRRRAFQSSNKSRGPKLDYRLEERKLSRIFQKQKEGNDKKGGEALFLPQQKQSAGGAPKLKRRP